MKTKVISFFLFLIFSLFAYWQSNDLDPVLWVSIYGLIAFISLLRVFSIFSRPLAFLLMAILFVYSFWYIGGVFDWIGSSNMGDVFGTMKPSQPYIEETREYLGLIIGALGLFLHLRLK